MDIGESEKARNRRRRQRILENPTRRVGAAATRRQRELDRQAALLETRRMAGARQVMRRFTRRYRPTVFRLPGRDLKFLEGAGSSRPFMDFMRRFLGQRVRIQYVTEDGEVVQNRNGVVIGTMFNTREKDDFVSNYLMEYGDGDLLIIPGIDDYKGNFVVTVSAQPTGEFGEQFFQHGFTNCVLRHLNAWANTLKDGSPNKKSILNKLEALWVLFGAGGVPESSLQRICDDLIISIRILSPYSHKEIISVQKEGVKRMRKKFTFINTRENHVELLDDVESKPVTQEEMNDLFELKADGTIWKQSRDGVVYWMRDGVNEYRIIEDECKETIEFKRSIQGFDTFNNEQLKTFIQFSHLRMGTVNGRADRCEDTIHIDQKNSYASFKKCPFYTGFPAFITDNIQACDRIQGEGFYFVKRFVSLGELKFVDKLLGGIFVANNVYPANILKLLSAKGGEYEITCGCWGNTIDLEFPDEMIENKSYQKYIGTLEVANKINPVRVHGVDYNWLGQVEDLVARYGDIKEILLPKPCAIYRGHISSYLIGYSACQTIHQLSTMDLDHVVRVCVDGIYSNETDVTLTGSFRFKNEFKLGNTAGGLYFPLVHSGIKDEVSFLWDAHKSLFPNRVMLAYGPGGSGKTYYLKYEDPGTVETLFVNPSHELCAANPDMKSVTHAKLLTDKVSKDGVPKWVGISRRCSTLAFDEASMLTKKEFLKIVKRFPYHKIIFCGDLGYQLPPVTEGDEIIEEDFEYKVEFKKDRRSHDKETRRFKKWMRAMMRDGYGIKDMFEGLYKMTSVKKPVKLSDWRKAQLKQFQFKDSNDDVESVIRDFVGDDFGYQVEDMIICFTHKICDEYTEYLKEFPKFKILKKSRNYQNGNIVFEEPESLNEGSYELRHGYTIHSSQGKTLKHRLFIDVRKMRCPRMLYTALSRVHSLSQVVLIDGP